MKKKFGKLKIAMLCRMLIFALMIAPVTALAIPMTAHAYNDGDILNMNQINEVIHKKLNRMLASMLQFTKQNATGGNLVDTLTWKTTEMGIVQQVWNQLSILGVCFAIMYFLIEMNHAVFLASSNWTMQSLVTPIIKFGIVICVIQYGDGFVNTILSFGNWFIGVLATGGAVGEGLTYAEVKKINELGFVECAFTMITSLVCLFISMLVSIIFVYKAFSYKLEVMFRVAITPIVFGDVWDGRNSHAIRWLKKLAGLMLYGGAFILIIKLGYDLQTAGVMNTYITSAASMPEVVMSPFMAIWALIKGILLGILIPIAEIGALSLAKNACMEVFG